MTSTRQTTPQQTTAKTPSSTSAPTAGPTTPVATVSARTVVVYIQGGDMNKLDIC